MWAPRASRNSCPLQQTKSVLMTYSIHSRRYQRRQNSCENYMMNSEIWDWLLLHTMQAVAESRNGCRGAVHCRGRRGIMCGLSRAIMPRIGLKNPKPYRCKLSYPGGRLAKAWAG